MIPSRSLLARLLHPNLGGCFTGSRRVFTLSLRSIPDDGANSMMNRRGHARAQRGTAWQRAGAAVISLLQRFWRRGGSARDAADLAAAAGLLGRGDHAAAERAASDIVGRARRSKDRNSALTILAWAALGERRLERARWALDQVEPRHSLDLHCFAALQAETGKPELAIQALELAQSTRNLCCGGAKLLIDLYLRQDRLLRAFASALENRRVLGVDNCRMVVKAACDAGEYAAAAALASALFGVTCAPEDASALLRASAYMRHPGGVLRVLDEVVARFRKVGKLSHVRTILLELRVDWRLPSGFLRVLDGSLLALDGLSASSPPAPVSP
jgi:hypothetical protein